MLEEAYSKKKQGKYRGVPSPSQSEFSYSKRGSEKITSTLGVVPSAQASPFCGGGCLAVGIFAGIAAYGGAIGRWGPPV